MNTVQQGPWFAEHSNFIGTVVKSGKILLHVLVRVFTVGDGSGRLRVWNESPMMSWMGAFVDNAGGDSADDEKVIVSLQPTPERIFWIFSSNIRFIVLAECVLLRIHVQCTILTKLHDFMLEIFSTQIYRKFAVEVERMVF